MKAAILDEYRHPLRIDTVADPAPRPGEALIRIDATGVCRTDWHFWHGDWDWLGIRPAVPVILGHEFSGTVVEVGEGVKAVRPGDRVTVPFHESCGHCTNCVAGLSNRCQQPDYPVGTHSGSFAEFIAVPAADFNCVQLPDDVDFAAGALLGCRYMTGYRAVCDVGRVRAGQSLLILGAGGMGLSALQIATAVGATVLVVDPNPAARAKAKALGAAHAFDTHELDGEAIGDLTGGGVDVAVDTICRQDTVVGGLTALKAGGTFVESGLTTDDLRGIVALPIDLVTARELSIKGAYGNPRSEYGPLMSLVASGRLDPTALVEERIDLADITDVMHRMSDYSTVGVVVVDSFTGTGRGTK